MSPPGTTGRTTITVTTPLGSGGNSFTYTDLPTISSVSPNNGSSGGGNTVTITGEHFTGASVVQFGQNHSVFTVTSDTSITATVPEGFAGTVDVFVTTQQGANVQSTADQYTYYAATPTVTGVSPSSGVLACVFGVTITGTNFNGTTNVLFGNVSANYAINSPTSITATVPPSSTTGAVDITVMNPSGTSAKVSADHYAYTAEGAPTVTAISPNSGFESQGNAPVQITGTNFTGATAVMFGTLKASGFQVLNDTTISAGSAILPAGSYDVTVVTLSGTSATSSADVYTALPQSNAPSISTISPQSGTPSGGTTVFITGSQFHECDRGKVWRDRGDERHGQRRDVHIGGFSSGYGNRRRDGHNRERNDPDCRRRPIHLQQQHADAADCHRDFTDVRFALRRHVRNGQRHATQHRRQGHVRDRVGGLRFFRRTALRSEPGWHRHGRYHRDQPQRHESDVRRPTSSPMATGPRRR